MAQMKQPGDWIADRFQVFEVYQGGMSVVYVVNDHYGTTGRQLVALKTLRDELLVYRTRRSRFAKECRLWVQLGEHPHIVQAHSVEVFAGRPYVVLELIRGGDLNHWIRSPKLDLIQALKFGVHFCLGLEHALRQGLSCHRDIKPANLLITAEGTLKLTDFGLANVSEEMVAVRAGPADDGAIPLADVAPHQTIRWSDPRDQPPMLGTVEPPRPTSGPAWVDGTEFDQDGGIALDVSPSPGSSRRGDDAPGKRLTQDGVRIGTAVYMSPEQFRDPSSVDVRADIYSFGVVFFEMIAGHPPFKADSVEKLEHLHTFAKPPSIAASVPPKLKKLAPEIEALIGRCLKKAPVDRFAKVSDLRKGLVRILARAGIRI
jgi:serine/threonine protein kinase